jgi:hypothetical protein
MSNERAWSDSLGWALLSSLPAAFRGAGKRTVDDPFREKVG